MKEKLSIYPILLPHVAITFPMIECQFKDTIAILILWGGMLGLSDISVAERSYELQASWLHAWGLFIEIYTPNHSKRYIR